MIFTSPLPGTLIWGDLDYQINQALFRSSLIRNKPVKRVISRTSSQAR